MLLISKGHLAATYSFPQSSTTTTTRNNNKKACNPGDPVAAYSALLDLYDCKHRELSSFLQGESQLSFQKHCGLTSCTAESHMSFPSQEEYLLLSRILRSSTHEWGHFPEHRWIRELVWFPSSLTVPLFSSSFPTDADNFTPCSRAPHEGNGFQCRFTLCLGTTQAGFLYATANN